MSKREEPNQLQNIDPAISFDALGARKTFPKQIGEIDLEQMNLKELIALREQLSLQLVAESSSPDFDWGSNTLQDKIDTLEALIRKKGDDKFIVKH